MLSSLSKTVCMVLAPIPLQLGVDLWISLSQSGHCLFLATVIGSGVARDPMRLLLGLLFFPLDLNPKGGKAKTVLNILLPKGKAILKMGPNYRVKRR